MLFTFLFLFSSCSCLKRRGGYGQNFVDDFTHFDEAHWYIDQEHLHCDHDQCVFIDKDSVEFVHYRPKDKVLPQHNEVRLSMHFGCGRPQCCESVFRCAKYQGGHLISKHAYRYGSFQFLALAAHHASDFPQEGIHDAWSCFTISSDVRNLKDDPIGFSICIPSQNPWTVYAGALNRNASSLQEYDLSFNAAKHMAWYRMEWYSDRILFFVNRHQIGIISTDDVLTPDRPLHIKVDIIPQMPQTMQKETDVATFKMHLYRFKYRKFHHPYVHTDLFVLNEGKRNLLPWFLALSIVVIIILYFLKSTMDKTRDDTDVFDGSYTLLNEKDRG